jgi:lipopolysaccharide export LptBFGC system permease protein LptF
MTKLLRYLFFKNFSAVLIILSVITFLLIVLQSLKFFDLVINKGFSFTTLIYIAFLTIPKTWIEVLPFVILIGTVFTWNQMLNNYEIIIMQAVGMTPFKLGLATILSGIIFSIISFCIVSFIAPKTLMEFFKLRKEIASRYNIKLIEQGRFTNIGNDITFYVKEIKGNQFYDIVINSEKNPDKKITLFAEKGYADFQNGKIVMLLDNASIIEASNIDTSIGFYQIDKYLFDFNTEKSEEIVINRNDPDDFYLQELLFNKEKLFLEQFAWNQELYDRKNKDATRNIIKRLFISLYPLIISVFCAYFFVNSYFSRLGNVKPIVKAVLLSGGIKIISIVFLLYALPIYSIVFMVLILPFILGIILFYKTIYPLSLKTIAKLN